MDILQQAIYRAKLCVDIPIVPKFKPKPAPASKVVELEAPIAKRAWAAKLPGVAPWRGCVLPIPPPPLEPSAPRVIGIKQIIAIVAAHFQVSWEEITGPCRDQRIVAARHIAQFLCIRLTTRSTPTIGRAFGGRDHSTVVNACKRIRARVNSDPDTRELVNKLEDRIRGIAAGPAA